MCLTVTAYVYAAYTVHVHVTIFNTGSKFKFYGVTRSYSSHSLLCAVHSWLYSFAGLYANTLTVHSWKLWNSHHCDFVWIVLYINSAEIYH